MRSPRFSTLHSVTLARAGTELLSGGFLRIYASPRPKTADNEPIGPMLAELRFADPAFSVGNSGIATANPIESEPDAPASGRATWFRATTATGEAVFDGSVGTTDADLVVDEVDIRQHAEVLAIRFGYAVATG